MDGNAHPRVLAGACDFLLSPFPRLGRPHLVQSCRSVPVQVKTHAGIAHSFPAGGCGCGVGVGVVWVRLGDPARWFTGWVSWVFHQRAGALPVS